MRQDRVIGDKRPAWSLISHRVPNQPSTAQVGAGSAALVGALYLGALVRLLPVDLAEWQRADDRG